MKRICLVLLLVTVSRAAAHGQWTPIINPSERPLLEALRAEGNFNTLASLIEAAGFQNLGVKGKTKVTLLAPNDEAFARLPPGTLAKLKADPEAIRDLLRGHATPDRVTIKEMLVFVPDGSGKTYKEVKVFRGDVISLQCNGMHGGEHHPSVNKGAARIGKGDILFAQGVIHEIDAVLVGGAAPHTP